MQTTIETPAKERATHYDACDHGVPIENHCALCAGRQRVAAKLDMLHAGFGAAVVHELRHARREHPQGIANYHDGYGRLIEEVQEFFDEVRRREKDRDPAAALKELIQVAAMAQRTAEDLGLVHALPVYYAKRA